MIGDVTDEMVEAARAAHQKELNRYLVDLVTVANRPVSVFDETDKRVWGPGVLWEAEIFIGTLCARAALEAALAVASERRPIASRLEMKTKGIECLSIACNRPSWCAQNRRCTSQDEI